MNAANVPSCHGITSTDSMLYTGKTPWHTLGKEVTAASFREASDDAFGWNVGTRPMFSQRRSVIEIGGEIISETIDYVQNPDTYEIYREDTGAVLGVTGKRWTPLQNREAFDVFQPLVDSGDIELHTAGSLFGGKRIWIQCKIAQKIADVIGGDPVELFLLLANGHDGKLAVHTGFNRNRVVCQNTLSAALNSADSKLVRVRHHANVKKNVEALRDCINLATMEFEATIEQYRQLAARQINQADLEKYVKIVMLGEKKAEETDLPTRTKNAIDSIVRLMETGIGANIPGVRGTYWGAYNAITEELSHNAGRNADNRYDSLWFGKGAKMNAKALELALQMSAA